MGVKVNGGKKEIGQKRASISKQMTKCLRTYRIILGIGLLGSLYPKFYHKEHKPVDTNNKDNNNTSISPSIIFFT